MSVMDDPRKHDRECPRPKPERREVRRDGDRVVWFERCPTCRHAAVYDRPADG